MTTLRSSIIIDRPADAVWRVIRAVPDISEWFPGMRSSSGDQSRRTVVLTDGSALVEEIVALDDELRRLQYRAVDGDLPVETHLGTVDVFDIGEGRSLVSYSTEIEPADLAEAFGAAVEEAVQNLPSHLA